MNRSTALLAIASLAAVSPAVAGGATLDKVRVGLLPINAVAPVYLGVKRGIFAAEGIEVEPVTFQGGAALVPAVVRDDVQIGFSNVVSLILAAGRGIPLQAVANGATASRAPTGDATVVLTKGDGPVRSVKDLEGRIVAIDSLGNIGDLTVRRALEKSGVDVTKVKFVELPFPLMLDAINAGRVDAAYESEPFFTLARDQKMRVLMYPYYEAFPGMTVTLYFASKEFGTRNPQLLARFGRALNASLDYAQTHPAEARAIVPEYTKISADVASRMNLPIWSTRVNTASISDVADLMVRYGMLKARPDLAAFAVATAAQ